MSVTINDIAKRANVSNATVSRILNSRSGAPVSEKMRDLVLTAAREMGYNANPIAHALATGRTYLIGLWIPNIQSGFWTEVINNFHGLTKADGYEIVVSKMLYTENPKINLAEMNRMNVDGILMYDSGPWGSAYLKSGMAQQTPYLSLGTLGDDTLMHIGVDLETASRQAMEHLVKTGHKRITFCADRYGGDNLLDSRAAAYRSVMLSSGLEMEYLRLEAETYAAAHHAFLTYVSAHRCPDALFCRNDEIAIGIHRAVRELGLSIPQDVAIIGCDDIEVSRYLTPSLSTIHQPIQEACHRGWQEMKRLLANPQAEIEPQTLTASFLKRESA